MAKFEINKPITTKEARVKVDAGLKPGEHRFQLEVFDSQGNKSKPALIRVLIKETR